MASSHKSGRNKLGSWREVRPGVWEVRVSKGLRKDGKQRTVYATVKGSESDAIAKAVSLADEMGKCLTAGDPMTLDTYFWGYFLPLKQATTTNANANTYKWHYRAHIADHFGRWRLEDIGNVDIQHWINGLPPQSASNYVRSLRAILNQAHFDHLKADAPMGGEFRYKMPRGKTNKPLPVWSAEEVAQALVSLRGEQLYPLFLVMIGCGLSRSEALALDWEDIVWDKVLMMDSREHWTAIITVKSAYTSEDGMKDPKNDRRYRSIPMQPPFSDALHDTIGTGPICQSKRHTKDGWKLTGSRMTPGYVPKRWKDLFQDGAPLDGLPFIELNRLRATYATMMQRAGIDRTIINAMQGRTDNSPVLYTNYLNPGNDTFVESAQNMGLLLANE